MEDVAEGWPNGCEGLKSAPTIESAEGCKGACSGDLNCSVWQYSGVGETADPNGHCYYGTPVTSCRWTNWSAFKISAGQRFQRGDVKVLKAAYPNLQILGLVKYDMEHASHDLDVGRCKDVCYSDVTCGVWQYSVAQGCWRQHKGETTGKSTDSPFALNVTAGEYILHYCPTKPPEPEPGPNLLPWIILGVLAGLALCCGILYAVMHKPKKPKKTRAVKIEKKDEEAVVPLFIPQPTVLVQQPSVVYAAPAPTTSVVYTTPSVSYTQVAQPTYTTSVAAPATYVTQQPTTYMTQPTAVSEAVAVQEPLLGETVVVGQ